MKFKSLALVSIVSIASLAACNSQKNTNKESITLKSEIDTVSYSLGVSIGQSIKSQGLDTINADAFVRAIQDVFDQDSLMVSNEQANQLLHVYFQGLHTKKTEKNSKEGQDFLA
ncbi:MAG TPA: FKBP-type peptidyl-prolyl cis-trans isomerase N-terminal domain-containing protein, partial [Flavisolibacter sp.]|nr:FKBP-type peptidyl-prolyl cis-trans isomerase N-terminal domain-containing protein [Flavisolibacter sp.]